MVSMVRVAEGWYRANIAGFGLGLLGLMCTLASGAQETTQRNPVRQSRGSGATPTFLERVQEDVANIARDARGAIVTIEDARVLAGHFNVSEVLLKSALAGGTPVSRADDGQTRALNKLNNTATGKVSGQYLQGNSVSESPKSGSGFCIGDGYILTTVDVAQGMLNPVITTDRGEQIRVRLIAQDSELNVALMRVVNPNKLLAPLPELALGDSSLVVPGHFAICIGNQSGQFNSVVLSMISGIRAQGFNSANHFYSGLLQIDGPVGAGTSGAPILNARGEVIGMVAAALGNDTDISPESLANLINRIQTNTIITNGVRADPSNSGINNFSVPGNGKQAPSVQSNTAPSRATQRGGTTRGAGNENNGGRQQQRGIDPSQNNLSVTLSPDQVGTAVPRITDSVRLANASSCTTGFAIPVNAFKGLISTLKGGQNIVHAWLGTELEEVTELQGSNESFVRMRRSVKIKALYAKGPAAKSGALKPGDLLMRINAREVTTANDVRSEALVNLRPGQKIEMEIVRGGKPMKVTMTVEARPSPDKALETLPPAGAQSRRQP